VVIKHTWAYYYPSAFVGWVQVIYIYIYRERERERKREILKFSEITFLLPKKIKLFLRRKLEGSFEIFLNISFFEMEYRNLINYLADMSSNHPCTTVIKWGGQGGCHFVHLFSAQDTDVPIYFLA
jgi:hypothetical protein